MKRKTVLLLMVVTVGLLRAEPEKPAEFGPTTDRVGFPKGYTETFIVLRTVNKPTEGKVVTVYGNGLAASVTNRSQLPYPYGSVIVMQTARVLNAAQAQGSVEEKAIGGTNQVLGLHVMRRERGFGEAYGKHRTGDWEYVEYKADGTYITPPGKSGTCAECHVKAGVQRDFVYRGRLTVDADQ